MRMGLGLWTIGSLLVAQGCSFSNAPFFPIYNVDVSVTDVNSPATDNAMVGTFSRGTIEAITTVGSCVVQLQLGQCKNGEEVWLNFKALPNDPNCRGSCTCRPSVWERIKAQEGGSLPLAPTDEATRGSGMILEVMAGTMQDTDHNGVIDKHSAENRIATRSFTNGKLTIYKATDSPGSTAIPPYGEFLADLEASQPGVGSVQGRIDSAVDALDGLPVGPRCHWAVDQLREDN